MSRMWSKGAAVAEKLPADLLIFEGSGSALPPIKVNRAICIAGADQPYDYLLGYLGTYRMLISDLVVLTMCEEPLASPEKVDEHHRGIKALKPGIEVIPTVLRPKPDGDIEGKRVAYFTTAQGEVVEHITGLSSPTRTVARSNLSRPSWPTGRSCGPTWPRWSEGDVDVFLTEIKAAAIDVVTEEADRRGIEVVFCDNVPVEVDGRSGSAGSAGRPGRSRRSRNSGRRMSEHREHLDLQIVDKEYGIPYSKGLMAQSLMATGLPPERSYHIAREIEQHLIDSGESSITLDPAARDRPAGAGRGRRAQSLPSATAAGGSSESWRSRSSS